jgi:2-(1,2-epoxy-1,2-dihydrophenyl)acetyl-CoA isomerase
MTDDVVLLSIDSGVATITLNRPDQGNAMSLEVMERLLQVIRDAETDPACHVAVVRANGRVFCGGGDLGDLAKAANHAELKVRMVNALQDAMFAFAASRLVVISAVNGAAAGAGLGLVLNTDIVLASNRASFHGAYGAIGLSPDAGVSHLLPGAIGAKRAAYMLLAGVPVPAPLAHEWGLVAELVEADQLEARAAELAAKLATGPRQALAPTKKLLGTASIAAYRAQLDQEAASITALSPHSDTQERIQAMMSRAPK